MTYKKRRIISLLVVVALISTFAVSAFAAEPNCQDTDITNISLSFTTFSAPIDSRAKTDTSPVYLHILDSGYSSVSVSVQTLGTKYNYPSSSNVTNLTYSNGAIVNQVHCIEGWQYSIHSLIYESNFRLASLRFRAGMTIGQTLWHAVWSPDSVGSYHEP